MTEKWWVEPDHTVHHAHCAARTKAAIPYKGKVGDSIAMAENLARPDVGMSGHQGTPMLKPCGFCIAAEEIAP